MFTWLNLLLLGAVVAAQAAPPSAPAAPAARSAPQAPPAAPQSPPAAPVDLEEPELGAPTGGANRSGELAIRGLRFHEVELDDRFWAPAMEINRRRTLPAVWNQTKSTGRIENFKRAAGKAEGPHQGLFFNDSDVYKLFEGASYIQFRNPDDFRELELEDLAKLIVAAQQPNGYINTYFTLAAPDKIWSDVPKMHEMYCVGHLIEAGVASWQSTGRRILLDASKRAVANLASVFGPNGRRDVPGHPGLELALLRLYEVTEDPGHLALAQWLIDQRGVSAGRPSAGEYAQDHLPLREQSEVVGHAVRATYLFAGATLLAQKTGDVALADAMRRLFADLVSRKLYLTGGIGSSAQNEGFTRAFDLPNDGAYAETCAAIGLVLWAHEMHLLDRSAKPIEVLERALYNAVRGGVSLSGDSFFYSNPLASRGHVQRSPWFECACCPPNLLRTFARVGDYFYSRDRDTLYVNLFGKSATATSFGRAVVRVTQQTDFPHSGKVQLWVEASKPATFTLAVRVPEWSDGITIVVNREVVDAPRERGYALITREWTPNDFVDVELSMPVRVIAGNPEIPEQKGRVALARGPLVYCVEGVDSAPDLRSLVFDAGQQFTVAERADLLGGITTISGVATRPTPPNGAALPEAERIVPFTAVPFAFWANREPGPMTVWLPTSAEFADRPIDPSVRATASHCHTQDSVTALHDGLVPNSDSGRRPRFSWWPRQGTAEWVQYDFASPRSVTGVEMHWFDDTAAGGGCGAPDSFRVLRRDGDAWVELASTTLGGSDGLPDVRGTSSQVTWDPITTTGLRLEVTLRPGTSAGLLEWTVLTH